MREGIDDVICDSGPGVLDLISHRTLIFFSFVAMVRFDEEQM